MSTMSTNLGTLLTEVFPQFDTAISSTEKKEVRENFASLESNDSGDVHISQQPPCDKLIDHVSMCTYCQKHLSFDPVEKALLKTHSVKNELFEVILYIAIGIFVIICLRLFVQMGEIRQN